MRRTPPQLRIRCHEVTLFQWSASATLAVGDADRGRPPAGRRLVAEVRTVSRRSGTRHRGRLCIFPSV